MMWGFYGGPWWWMLFGGISMLVFWGAVIWLVVWGIRQLSQRDHQNVADEGSPLEIAQRRLARGEISQEEYEEMRNTLQH